MQREVLTAHIAVLLRGSGAFPYEEWSDDAGGDYSIEKLANLIVGYLAELNVVSYPSEAPDAGPRA